MIFEIDNFDCFLTDGYLQRVMNPYTRLKKGRRFIYPRLKFVRCFIGGSVFQQPKQKIYPESVAPILGLSREALFDKLEVLARKDRVRVGVRSKDSLVLILEAYTRYVQILMEESG